MRWVLVAAVLAALIVVPFLLFEPQFERLGARIVAGELAGWTAAAIVSGFLALDVVLPVPSSIVATGAGALFGFLRGTGVVWAGLMAGSILGYGIGAWATGATARLVGTESLGRARQVAADHGDWAIVLSRPVPILAEASVILAGVMHVPLGRFMVLTGTSNLGIAAAYASIGAYAVNVGSWLPTFAAGLALPALAMLAARRWLRPVQREDASP